MSDEHWIWHCDQVIPSDTAAGRRILDQVLDQLKAQQWAGHDIFCVHLAMDEALVNAIMHGNRFDAGKQVRISCRLAPERVRITIADEGAGFDPNALPDPTTPARLREPRGRGVMLMRAFMSRVEFSREGNCVVLEKQRSRGA